jgi:hypothetical protein
MMMEIYINSQSFVDDGARPLGTQCHDIPSTWSGVARGDTACGCSLFTIPLYRLLWAHGLWVSDELSRVRYQLKSKWDV